jgi:hypothetical protein
MIKSGILSNYFCKFFNAWERADAHPQHLPVPMLLPLNRINISFGINVRKHVKVDYALCR